MTKTELLEIINNGENSGAEFKRDDVHPQSLAKEIASLANLEGGCILLGIEDDGSVTGILRPNIEEWVMNICQDNVQPSIMPYFETVRWEGDKKIGVITIPQDSPDKPYKARQGNRWVTFVRLGSTTREATREQEQRLYQSSGVIRYDIKPVSGSSLPDLDLRRLTNYFKEIRGQDCPQTEETEAWETLLINTEIMVESRGKAIPTVGGMLLFGKNPNRFLPQAGITAVAYPGREKDYSAKERTVIRGPVVALSDQKNNILEDGIIGQALNFIRRNISVQAYIDNSGRRIERWDYPIEAYREAIVNAIAHRDYTITGTDIEVSIYSDRLEVISPGRLPNTVTIERMKAGCRATRNELIKEVLRDYHHIEATGLGIPRKIIAGMLKHNGTEPDLIEEEYSFTLRLWKEKQ